MATLRTGHRIGKLGRLRCGCSATIFDDTRQKILLTRRTDNGRWCLPGGGMDVGESVTETCEREVQEETGLHVRVTKLIGVYSTPHRLLEYADGNRWHMVGFHFAVEVIGGALTLTDETTEVAYFTRSEIEQLDLMEHHRERIADAFADQAEAFIR
ncbi:MAG: NUDIX domain-containing protein [Chloroflexota bacterium]|nr:NUDIX domain-containing protein [Chloroflexota bacterium]